MEQRFEKKDIHFLIACALITVVCLAVGIHFFYRAFPEATIDFQVTRNQARDQAVSFLQERGLEVDAYRHSAIFRYDDRAKTFLERELGLEGATAIIGYPVRLWRWSNRWTRELQKEEFRVEITTSGELVGFQHQIEEEREGAELSEIEARFLAEEFVVGPLQRPIASLEFVEARTIARPHRADHTFTWKLRGFDVEGASYRLRIAVHGDQIGGFSEFLKVPEAWERDYEELRSHNLATGLIASFFLVLTLLAMLVVFFVNIRQRDIRWKTAVIFGGIAFVLTLLANLNNLPVTEYAYETTETYGSYLTNQLLVSLLSALAQGLFILFLTAAAEPVYRRAYGDQIRLNEQFQPHGMRTKRFLLGTVLGLTMTAFFFAYQTIFYLIAEKFGAWSPAQIPYDEMVNTYIPWIMVLLIGFLPAVSEEFISRAFSIPFLQRYLKSRWAAVVISALIWGFAHATYPQQPFFIRGLEVGIAGIIIGAVMLRWGILAPLVWHYTVDALYTALILLRSSNSYFVISAALSAGILLLPLLVATLIYLRRRFFVDPTSMLNRADSPPLASEQAPEAGELLPPEAQLLRELPDSVLANYRPLSGSRLGLAAVIVAVFASLLFLEVERPLQQVDFALTSDEARQKAIEHLQASGTQPDTFDVAVFQQHQPDGDAIKYILERASIDRVNQYYTQDLRASLWMVRFFRPLQKEEFWVEVDPQNGEIYSVRHLLDEDAPGADLEEEEARIIAEEHMRAYGLDPDAFELKQSSSEKLDARRDHRFIWEAREGDPRNLDELHFRCEVRIAGDQPVALRRHFKLPEAWQRERDESTTLQATLGGLRIALIVAVALHLLYLLIRQVRSGGISWLSLIKIGTLAGLVVMLGFLTSLPALDKAYPTSITPAIFSIMRAVGVVFLLIGAFLATVGGLGLMSTLYPDWSLRLRTACSGPVLRDGLLTAALALIAVQAFDRLAASIQQQFAAHLIDPTPALVSGLDSWLPFWNGLSEGLTGALGLPMLLGIAFFYFRRILKKPSYAALALLTIGLASAGSRAHDSGEFALDLGLFALNLLFALLVVVFLLRNNLLAYILFGFLSSGLDYAQDLLGLSSPLYRYHGYALLASLFLSALVFLLWMHRQSERSLQSQEVS